MLVDDFLFNNSNQEHKHHANLNQLVPNYDRPAIFVLKLRIKTLSQAFILVWISSSAVIY